MAAGKTVTVQQDNWQSEVVDSTTPVLVDFWAEWCAPCRSIAPILEQISSEQEGKLKVAKVNVDEDPGLAAQFNVKSIPTLLLIKGGTVAEQMVGAVGKSQLMDKLEPHL